MVARTCGTPPQRTGPASPVSFRSSTRLRFDDSGNNALPIDLVGMITPSSIVVSNVTKDYTIGTSTSGSLGGQFTLTKTGAGKLTLTTDNSFEGKTRSAVFLKSLTENFRSLAHHYRHTHAPSVLYVKSDGLLDAVVRIRTPSH